MNAEARINKAWPFKRITCEAVITHSATEHLHLCHLAIVKGVSVWLVCFDTELLIVWRLSEMHTKLHDSEFIKNTHQE